MAKSGERSLLKIINEKTKKVKQSRYAIPAYILTVFLSSLWLIFVNPCLMNFLLPVIAIVIPFKFFDEESFKKILVAGLVVCLLVALSSAVYHTGVIYDQPFRKIHSDKDNLKNGTVNPVYGTTETRFNLTVELDKDFIDAWDRENYTLYANVSYSTMERIQANDYAGYKMKRINGTNEYYAVASGLPERMFNHYFSLRKNRTGEMGNMTEGLAYSWERTSLGFGPITLKRSTALWQITLQQGLSTSIIFLMGVGILWVKKRMDKSVDESTEGLEKKEEELEDYCPECGHLLEGKDECDRCGWMRNPDDEKYDEDGEED